MAYLDLDKFKLLGVMPDEHVDQLETRWPGFLVAQFTAYSAWIDSRLRKRYKAPFSEPCTEVIKLWLAQIVTATAYTRRGWDPSGVDVEAIVDDAKAAKVEVLEAANGENGLFELALTDTTDSSGVTKAATRGYSEAGPYVGFSKQAQAGREEDANGDGTYL